MKITFTPTDGKAETAKLPYDGAAFVEVATPCACGCTSIAGGGQSIESHDTYRAAAHCTKCRKPRGVLRVKMSTIFGVEEDERVLAGPWKVY